jgi:hypothetical protein
MMGIKPIFNLSIIALPARGGRYSSGQEYEKAVKRKADNYELNSLKPICGHAPNSRNLQKPSDDEDRRKQRVEYL